MSKYEISPSVLIKSCSPLHTNHTVRKKPSAVKKVQKEQIKLMVNFRIIICLPKNNAVIMNCWLLCNLLVYSRRLRRNIVARERKLTTRIRGTLLVEQKKQLQHWKKVMSVS